MLASIRKFFDDHVASPERGGSERHQLAVASAALLVEVMRLDGDAEAERDAVLRAVTRKFDLSEREAHEVVELAEAEVRDAVGYYQFTSLINRELSAEQKARIVEMLWEVAFADETLSAHEQHVIRKIADLLHVSHGHYIAAKLRARDRG